MKVRFFRLIVPLICLSASTSIAQTQTFTAPYASASSVHWCYSSDLVGGLVGTTYGGNCTIEETGDGVLGHYGFAISALLGGCGVAVRDEYRVPFTVSRSGIYEVKITARVSGCFAPLSMSSPVGANGCEYMYDIDGRVYDDSGFCLQMDQQTFAYDDYSWTDAGKTVLFNALKTPAVEDAIKAKKGAEALNNIRLALNDLGDAFQLINKDWLDKPVTRTLQVSLVAGKPYYWALRADSRIIAASALTCFQFAGIFSDIDIDSVQVTYLNEGSFQTPFVADVLQVPNTAFYGDPIILSADVSARTPGSSITEVKFYYDSNRNGVYDSNDTELGSGVRSGNDWMLTRTADFELGRVRYFARAKDSNNMWSDACVGYGRIEPAPAIQGNMISLVGTDWDDSSGNNNGVIETDEDIRLRLKLKSTGDLSYIMGYLSSSLGNMRISINEAQYPPVGPGGSVWPYGNGFDMVLDLNSDYTVPFTLYVEYCFNNQDYYQTFTLSKKFYKKGSRKAAFQVVGVVVDDSLALAPYNNNDGVIQSGESVKIRPLLKNTGSATATKIDMYLTYGGAGFTVDGASGRERYPDLSPGDQAHSASGYGYSIRDLLHNFSGRAYLDAHIVTEQNTTETVIADAVEVNIEPAAWLKLSWPRSVDFGVVAPGTTVTYTTRVENIGCASLQVTGITSSSPDTTWSFGTLPFTLNAGASRELVVSIDTTGMQGAISRQITVTSTGRLFEPGEHNVLTIGGLVSATVPLMTISGTGVTRPDISGGWIVWHESATMGLGDIWALNAGTGERRQITSEGYAQTAVFISGNLICWGDKRNNPDASRSDIYGYDLSRPDLGVFPVAVSGCKSTLIGVDNGLVASTLDYYEFTEKTNVREASNLVVYRYLGNGQFTQVYNSGFTSNSSHSPMQSYSRGGGGGDLGGGLLVVYRHEIYWDTSYSSPYWRSRNQRMQVINFAAGETAPRDAKNIWNDVRALSNRFLYTKSDENGDNQLFMWKNNGAIEQLTSAYGIGYGDREFAAGGEAGAEVLVYDCRDSSRPGLYYTDRTTGIEAVISSTVVAGDLRMDGMGFVFVDYASSPYTLKYAFLKQPDVQVTSGGITFSDDSPVEGQAIACTVQVRNLTNYGQPGNITVSLFDGDPDNGGKALGAAQTFAGLPANSSRDVVFSGINGLVEGNHTIYARVNVSTFDPPNNNTAFRAITVKDSDTQKPTISNIAVTEVSGDGDGVIGSDERIRISWSAEDASGIASMALTVDGLPVATQGVWYAELGPLATGVHTGVISATDGDLSPETRVVSFTFDVVECERIGVVFGNRVVEKGQSAPVNLGSFVLGGAVVPQPFAVRNNGAQRLDLGALTVAGNVTPQAPELNSVVAGASTFFYLTPSTAAKGAFTGTVSLASSDLAHSPFTFKVCYEVSQPVLAVSPGNHSVNWTASSVTFNVTNQAPGTMNWTAQIIAGNDWSRISSGASGVNAGTITVALDENPIGSLARTATIRVVSDGAEGSPYDVRILQAAGPAISKILRIEGDLSFGVLTVGQTRTKELVIHNDGNSALTVSAITCPAGFSAQPDNFVVGSNQSVNVNVVFAPGAVQTYAGNVQISSDATAGGNSLVCSGTGTLAVELPEAVDSTNLVWETGGDADWFGQVNVTHDGIDAAQSGAVGDGQTSWLETTVTGPGQLSFWWKLSSEGGDALQFMINGVEQFAKLSGTTSWVQQKLQLEEGENVLRWQYIKNSSGNDGLCGAYVDQVVFSTTHICPPEDDAVLTTTGSYDGYLYASRASGDKDVPTVQGTLNVKLSNLNGRLTAKAVLQAGSVSFSGRQWTGRDGDGTRFATLTARSGERLDLFVRQNRIWGSLAGGKAGAAPLELSGVRNRFADRKDVMAQAILNQYKGYYTATLFGRDFIQGSLNAAPHGYGYLTLTVNTGGRVRIAGVLADGTRVSQSAQLLHFADCGECFCVPFFVPLYRKTGCVSGLFWIDPETRGMWCEDFLWWEKFGAGPDGFTGLLDIRGGPYNNKSPVLQTRYVFGSQLDWELAEYHAAGEAWGCEFEPMDVPVNVTGSRMIIARGDRPVRIREYGETWYEYGGENPNMVTLNFTARTGIFRGNFTLYYDYTDERDRSQHKTVKVPYVGVMLQDPETGRLESGHGHGLFPSNDPELKAYKIKPSFPVELWSVGE